VRYVAEVDGQGFVVALHIAVIELQDGFAVVGGTGYAEQVAQVVEHGVAAGIVALLGEEPLAGLGGFCRFTCFGHGGSGWVRTQVGPTRRDNLSAREYSMLLAVFNRIV